MTEQAAGDARGFRYGGASGRRSVILRRLRGAAYVSLSELGRELDVSDRTIRRDLMHLAAAGVVQLVPGGATMTAPRPGPGAGPATDLDVGRRLAAAAVTLVAPGSSVGIDGGEAADLLVDALPAAGRPTVVTASLDVMGHAAARGLDLIGVGGELDPASRTFVGPVTREGVGQLRLGVLLLVTGAVGPSGAYCGSHATADVARAFLGAAARRVLVCPPSAFGADAPVRIAPLDAFDVIVTAHDEPADHPWLVQAGVEILRA